MGSSNTDWWGYGIAVDGSGNVYVSGDSYTTWGSPVNAHTGYRDAFAAKLNSSGALQWNTFMGSSDNDNGYSIAVDGNDNVYVTGYSVATWGSPVNAHAAGSDAFVAKLNSSGNRLANTFMGSSSLDYGNDITVAGSGVYVTGLSCATWGSPVNAPAGSCDVFVARLDSGEEPNLVTLSGFNAHPVPNRVILSWTTAFERDNAGFYIWRRELGGEWHQLNAKLIPATGNNSVYRFTDDTAEAGQNYEYRLEDIDFQGLSCLHLLENGIVTALSAIRLLKPKDGAALNPDEVPVFAWEGEGYEQFRFQYAWQGVQIHNIPAQGWRNATTLESSVGWAAFANARRDAGIPVYWRVIGQGKNGAADVTSEIRYFKVK